MDSTGLQPGGPRGWPLLGHAPAFLSDKLGFLARCASVYGPVTALNLGEPTYLLNDADDIRHVLATNAANYDKTTRLTSRKGRWLSGAGLLTSSGAQHLRQRKMMQPCFHARSIAVFADGVAAAIAERATAWTPGRELDIADEMMALAQQSVLRSLFGADVHDQGAGLAAAIAVRRRFMDYVFFSHLPFAELLPVPIRFAYRRAMARIDRFIYAAIARRRADAAPPGDLLAMLVQARYPDGSAMDDRQVRDEALTISITGFETVGEALAWTWYLLARHPEVEARLVAEVADVLQGRPPTLADLPKLRYAAMVLEEALRLYPPTWIYIRMARGLDRLPSGVAIPAGAKLYLCPYVVHRNPRYYPDPERFDPERFTDAAKAARPRLAYFPFGHGPRVCLGEAFARMEAVLVLASIIQRFRLELLPGQSIVPEPRMTLHPKNGIRMRLMHR